MTTNFDLFPNLLEMEQRLRADLSRYVKSERVYRLQWAMLEGIILFIGFITPFIVAYRKSGLYPTEFWVWWCLITPPVAAGCAILMRVLSVQDKCLTNRKRIRRMGHLLSQTELDIPLCTSDEKANELMRNWHKEAGKIEADY
ncbi:MAG: hypothetical protein JNJ57_15165 [Saprospiraceae bacterium]|nr:hypothetical protein [Saprospiraceae bacterium]